MNIQEICRSMLDNADLSIDLSAFPMVTLDMIVHGSVNDKFWKVLFVCGQVVHIDAQFDSDSENNERFLLLEARVNETIKKSMPKLIQERMDDFGGEDPIWDLYLYGSVSLKIVTTKFAWELLELSAQEYEAAYA